MFQNNTLLFFNIIKNSNQDFQFKEELFNLHKRSLQLESSLKMRRNIEYEYNKLKIEELKEKIEDHQFQQKFINRRNQNILDDIERNNQKSFELSSRSSQSFEDLIKNKEKYKNYLDSLQPKILSEFNRELFSQNNIFLKVKINEEEKLRKNENKNDYYDDLIKINENLVKEIKALKKRNESISLLNQEKEKLFSEKEEELKNKILVNYEEEPNLNQNNGMKKDRINEENTIIKNPRKLAGYNETIKLYELNRNHKFGKLDEIKQKEIDIINEKIKKEFLDKKNQNELNRLERDSLNDLRPQLYEPKKQFTNMGNISNTLFQNNQKISDINNNINNNNNDNIDKPTPNDQEINNDINNNIINNDINNNLNNNIYNNINNSANQNNNINNNNKVISNNKNKPGKDKEINIDSKENIDAIPEGSIPSGSNSQYADFEVGDTDNK